MTTKICLFYLIGLSLLALFPGLITPYSYETQQSAAILELPSAEHLMGTDELGRDLLARVLFGAKVSLACALLATLISFVLGILYGGIAGYYGGRLDQIMMRVLDIFYSIPDLLIYILLGLFLGRSFGGMLIALSALGWLSIARIMRGEILKAKEKPFIEAAHAQGLKPSLILRRHLIPQTFNPILVSLIYKIPAIILAESALSFIGLGLTPPYASWGTLTYEGYAALRFFPHLIVFPSLFIFLTIFCFQHLGEKINRFTFRYND